MLSWVIKIKKNTLFFFPVKVVRIKQTVIKKKTENATCIQEKIHPIAFLVFLWISANQLFIFKQKLQESCCLLHLITHYLIKEGLPRLLVCQRLVPLLPEWQPFSNLDRRSIEHRVVLLSCKWSSPPHLPNPFTSLLVGKGEPLLLPPYSSIKSWLLYTVCVLH